MFLGEIGGHCLIPNAKLLLESYDSEFLRLILKSNEERKKEMKNPGTKEQVDEIKKRDLRLTEGLMKKCKRN